MYSLEAIVKFIEIPAISLAFIEAQSDEKILSGISRLISADRKRKAQLVAYLSEAIRRQLYAKAGCGSMFRFLVEVHGMSEHSALKRIQAAKLAIRYPFLIREIARGTYSLTVLNRLAPFIKKGTDEFLFNASKRKSVREVESILLAKFPKEDVEERLKKTVSPLGGGRVAVQFTADEAFAGDLDEARALLSHRFPQGKMKDIIGLALKTLIRDLKREPRKKTTQHQSAVNRSHMTRDMQIHTPPTMPFALQNSPARMSGNRSRHSEKLAPSIWVDSWVDRARAFKVG